MYIKYIFDNHNIEYDQIINIFPGICIAIYTIKNLCFHYGYNSVDVSMVNIITEYKTGGFILSNIKISKMTDLKTLPGI